MDLSGIERCRDKLGAETWARLGTRLAEVNRDIRTRGIRSYRGQVDLLTGYAYDEFYDWDLYFECVYLSHYGVSRYARANLEAFLERQEPSGFTARTLINPRQRQQFKPFLAQVALLYTDQTGNDAWLRGRTYERLARYLDYWFWHCDFDRNGLPVWDSADHSGMDNQDRRAGTLGALAVEGVDLACYLARELDAMTLIAERLERLQDRDVYSDHAAQLRAQINTVFWDDDGFYYDRHERSGDRIRVRSVAGFTPLWAGVATPERARRLLDEHLLDPEAFWLPYPVATYARTERDSYQERRGGECNWCGAAWAPTNYMIFHGLRRYGYHDAAEHLAYRTCRMALAEDTTREYYNAETGAGQGLQPFWGWSALAYLMPLEFECNYDPTNLAGAALQPLARQAGLQFEEE